MACILLFYSDVSQPFFSCPSTSQLRCSPTTDDYVSQEANGIDCWYIKTSAPHSLDDWDEPFRMVTSAPASKSDTTSVLFEFCASGSTVITPFNQLQGLYWYEDNDAFRADMGHDGGRGRGSRVFASRNRPSRG